MEYVKDPEDYVGNTVNVETRNDDEFLDDFTGTVKDVRNSFLQAEDHDNDMWEVEINQVAVDY